GGLIPINAPPPGGLIPLNAPGSPPGFGSGPPPRLPTPLEGLLGSNPLAGIVQPGLVNIQARQTSQDDFNNLTYYAEYAAAAYCKSNTGTVEWNKPRLLTCGNDGSCPNIQASTII